MSFAVIIFEKYEAGVCFKVWIQHAGCRLVPAAAVDGQRRALRGLVGGLVLTSVQQNPAGGAGGGLPRPDSARTAPSGSRSPGPGSSSPPETTRSL